MSLEVNAPVTEFMNAVEQSGIRLCLELKQALTKDYVREVLDTPTLLHNGYRQATSLKFGGVNEIKLSKGGKLDKEFIPKLNPEALALSQLIGIVRTDPSPDIPHYKTSLKARKQWSFTCSDAEPRFHNAMRELNGAWVDYDRSKWVDIVVDKNDEPIFIKKRNDQPTALGLRDVLVRGRRIPAGTIFDLGLYDYFGGSADAKKRKVHVDGSDAKVSIYQESAIRSVSPIRLSMWFHETPEERAVFTHTKAIDDPNRSHLVETSLQDFTNAARLVIAQA